MQVRTIINFTNYINKLIISLLCILIPYFSFGQMQVSTAYSPQYLVDSILVGSGVRVSNVSYTGSAISIGSFTNGGTTNIGMDQGIILSTGNVDSIPGPNNSPNTQTNTLGGSDPQLATLDPGITIYDASVLEFDFIPMSDTIRFQYVFGSEEYSEWVGTNYNDVFGFFVTGINPAGGNYTNKNLAIVPGTANTIVSVNTINNGQIGLGTPTGPCTNCNYYIDNYHGMTITFDGFTVVLTSWLVVQPCTSYHIKLAIGDGNDHSYDSGVFLKKNSFSSGVLHVNTDYTISGINNEAVEGCNNAKVSFTLDNPSPYNRWIHYTIGGSAINGVDYQSIPDSVMIPTGSDSTGFTIIPNLDGITEGIENVRLIVETSSCSNDTLTIPIHDYDSVRVAINGDSSLCLNESSHLSTTISHGYGPYTYQWSTGAGSQNINVSPGTNTTYTVQATDACGISDTSSIGIVVHNLPHISSSTNPASICRGNSSNLQASGANTYQWSPGANLSSNSGNNVTASPTTTTTYTIIGTDANGCKDTTQTILTVKSLPTIQSTPSGTSICHGDSIGITVSGGASYTWSPSASLSNNNTSSVIAFPNVTTTYTVVGTGSNGCQNSATSIVAVNTIPNVQISPSNPGICIGANQSLHASGASTYQWTPTTNLSAGTGPTVIANPSVTTRYIVQGTDNHNCKNSDTITLSVYSKPNITLSPISADLCEGASTTINASGGTTYSWSPGTGLTTTTGSSVTASPSYNTTYTVTGTDNNGCSDTAISHITVSPNPIISSSDTVICIGESTTLNAQASLPGTSFSWNTGSSSQSINVSPITTSLYHVTATDGNGCTGADTITVTVNSLPNLSISPANSSICTGSNITVTASGASSYSWAPATNSSSQNTASTTLSPTATTNYTVTGIDGNGCSNTATTNIVVNSLPTVSITPTIDSICWGSSTSLSASGASSYTWSPAGGLSNVHAATVTASPTVPTQYIAIGTDGNGCSNSDTAFVFVSPVINISATPQDICLGDSSQLSVSSNISSTYVWNTGQTTSSFWVKPIDTTTYTVTVTTVNGCQRVSNVTVNVYLRPHVIVTPDSSSICEGEYARLTASGASTYTWQNNPTLSSTVGASVTANPTTNDNYMVIGVDQSGCKDTAYAKITVFPAINVSVTPGRTTQCQGIPVNLKSSGALTYAWTPQGSLNTAVGDSVIATPNNTTTYKVVGTDANGCKDSARSTVHINAKPIISVNRDTTNLCIGESDTLIAQGAFLYEWSPAIGLSSSTGRLVIASPTTTSTYTVIGTSQVGGCKDTTTAYVAVHSYPTITLTPTAVKICPNDSTTLTAGGADSYLWYPSLGLSDTTIAIVKAGPDSTQTYRVIGSNTYGCTDTLNTTVTVSPIPVISGNNYICAGGSTTLNVVSNLTGTTFIWNNGISNPSNTVSPINTTTYTVTATDGGCTKDTSFIVNVNAIPSLSVSPNDTTICPGNNVILNASGGNTYQWSPSTGLSSTSNAVVSAHPSTNTTYTLVGTTPAGCKDTVYAQVKLFTSPLVNVSPVSSFSCGGGSQTLTASGAASYSWSPASGLSGSTGSSVIAGPNINTTYTVTGTDTNSCNDTAIAHVYIYGPPTITPNNPNLCPGDSVQLAANTQNNPTSYLWSNGATTSRIYVSPSSTQIYSVTVNYNGSCSKSSQTTVNVYTDSTVSITTLSPSICHGDTATLIAQNCQSYNWTGINLINNTTNQVKATPDSNSQYIVRGTSIHHCFSFDTVEVQLYNQPSILISASTNNLCNRDTALLIGRGAQTYVWTPNTAISNTTNDSVFIFPHSSISYQVIGTDVHGCNDTANTLITVDPGPMVTILPDSPVVCQGDTMNLIASGAVNYRWWPNVAITNSNNDTCDIFPVSNITYHVRGYNNAGCSNDTSIYVNVRRKPFIGVLPNLDSICKGDTIPLLAYGASTYRWRPTNSISNSTGANINAFPDTTTTFCVIGTSTDGCKKEAFATIKVYDIPVINAFPINSTICKYDTLQLTATGGATYLWSPASSISTTMTGDSTIVSPLVSTQYKAIGTTIHGCKDSAFVQVNILSLPNVTISPDSAAICYGDSTLLTAQGANQYSWSPNIHLSNTNNATTWASPLINRTYIVSGTDANNCTNRDTIDIIVHPDIIPTATPNQDSICQGLSTTLNVGGGSRYLWSPSTGLSAINTSTVTANPNSSQLYTVKVFDAFNCVDSINVFLQVLNLPNVQINTIEQEICIGDSSTLIGMGAHNYQWSPSININRNNGDTISCFPVSSQQYILEGTDTLGCKNYDSTLIIVHDLPSIQLTAVDSTICIGDSTILQAAGASQYYWSPVNSLSDSLGNQVNATPLINTLYTVLGTDINNCVNYDSIEIIVRPRPNLSISTTDTIICSGYPISLTAHSNMNPTVMIWNSTDTATSITRNPTSDTQYQLRGINTYGCDDSVSINIQVNPFPVLRIQPDTIICYGDTISASTQCSLNNLSYRWNTGDSILCIPFHPTINTSYTLIATDSIGCSDTISTTIEVQSPAGLSIGANATHICAHSLLQLTANTLYPMTLYQWNIGSSTSTNTYHPIISTNYKLTATDSIGCIYDDSIYVMVNPIPQLQITAQPDSLCIGDTSQLSVISSVNPVNLLWNTNSSNDSILVSPSQTRVYSVRATDSIGCSDSSIITVRVYNLPNVQINPNPAEICRGDSIELQTISNIPIHSYQWNDNSSQVNLWVKPNNNTAYSVTATDIHGCINSTQQSVSVYSNPSTSISPMVDTICSFDSLQLHFHSNHPIQQILWNTGNTSINPYFSPMTSSYFNAIITDTNGCHGSDTAFIYVIQRPTCTLVVQSPICSNDSSKVEYYGSATNNAICNWDFDGGSILNGQGINPHYIKWAQAGSYFIHLDVTENGCTSFPDTANVIVNSSPVVTISALDTSICDSTAINFIGLPSGMQLYHWNFGDPLASGTDTSNLQDPSYTYYTAGNYGVSLSVISPEGCPGYQYRNSMIKVHPLPVADFIVNPSISYSNNPVVHFYDKSSIDVNYWEWDFGDANSGSFNYSNLQDPYHIYQTRGTYFSKLIVQNQWGCTDTAQYPAIIENGPTFYIPDAFTPNGDGVNDYFIPLGTENNLKTYRIFIYSRWGNKVFESNDYSKPWNGRYYNKGADLPDAVYSYIIYITDNYEVKRKYVGSILLYR